MTFSAIAIMGPGDMGHNVGRVLGEHGYSVLTCLAGRSERSRRLAAQAGLQDTESLEELLAEADILLSIMPPAAAPGFAEQVASLLRTSAVKPYFADCNALSPMTSRHIGEIIGAAGAAYIDAGIIGPAPGKGQPPRFWVSGEHAAVMDELDGKGIIIRQAGPEAGRASAIKMCYAALTKGTLALHTAVLITAERLGLSDELLGEFSHSQAATLERMKNSVPWLATDAGRWIGEMEEIAATFAEAGTTAHFHQGAAEIYRLLASTVLAEETRESVDKQRTLAEAVQVFART